jgi:hypothetical protein
MVFLFTRRLFSHSHSSLMEAKPKAKKVANRGYDADTPDSLVNALAEEILAPENINLLIPLTLFGVALLSNIVG